ncbi:MAG TPA: glycoside hydrolase family 2 TIM barrel-domain containing protein [Verrucomicrobiae bacterium]
MGKKSRNVCGITSLRKIIFLHILSAAVVCSGLTASQAIAREDTRLTDGWLFQSGDITNAAQPDFAAGDWQKITLPHSWGWAEAHQGRRDFRGPGWYRRELLVTPEKDKRYFLKFDAASTVAEVYLNGTQLGEHRGGFGAFAFEITTNLLTDGTNLLAVRVNNAIAADVAPVEGDFNVYGGLYRPVHLIVTDLENFAVTDHASPGVAWLQSSVSATQAVLDVTAQIANGTKQKHALRLTAKILDADGKEFFSTNQNITLVPRYTAPYLQHIVLNNPHLWNGRKDPYLYKAIVELTMTNGDVLDTVEQPLGLRSYYVDPDKGFFLNGKKYPIYGVCRHQDRPEKGWAITEADMAEDVALIKELGATAVRCAHYEHNDYFYRLCDQAGILIWAEIPQVDVIHDSVEFENTSRNQLLDLIRQNINHPSIFAWSLFNEIGNGPTEDPHRELQDLNNVAHGEDPTRPTIAAASVTSLLQIAKIPDLLGWNLYPGWYGGKPSAEAFGNWMDKMRYTSRYGGFCISEYGAGANIHQHEDNPKQPKPTGPWHPEEYQNVVHEADWAAIKSHPFIWGSFVWNMFDFGVATRHEGSQLALNDKGLVTYDRKTRKDAFYFYQANWSPEPVLHLTSQRFIERTNAVTEVKVYSNASEVELTLNGISQGKRSNDGNSVFVWSQVKLSPGENKVTAQATRDGKELTDSCVWKLATP